MAWQDHLTPEEAAQLEALKDQRDQAADTYRAYRVLVKNAAEYRLRKAIGGNIQDDP